MTENFSQLENHSVHFHHWDVIPELELYRITFLYLKSSDQFELVFIGNFKYFDS